VLQLICSYVLWPLAFLMGVKRADCRKVAKLIGTKTFLNEFVGYLELGHLIHNRAALQQHVARNGTWYWSDDDVILTSRDDSDDVLLRDGVISVQYRVNQSINQNLFSEQ